MPESNIFGDIPVISNIPLGAGKVFFVAQSGTDIAAQLQDAIGNNSPTDRFQFVPCAAATADVGIQAALDACVANRNDYVIVMPSTTSYSLGATLTMNKARTHLICPPGIGNMGMNNFARLYTTVATTNMITVTADCVEIAGFFFKGYDGTAHDQPAIIYLSGTRWTPNIHDNFFGIGATAASNNYGILADGACSHFNIHDNYFTNYAPGAMTGTDNAILAFIAITSTSSTRGVIRDNYMHTGANTTVTSGINCACAYAIIDNNTIVADKAVGGSQGGVVTTGITGVVSTTARRNTFHAVTGAFSGTTADSSNVLNYDATNGGTPTDEDIG